jgi:hypothetical protein
MNNTITLTDEQMKALQEGNSITIEPPKKEPEKFRCREDNKWYCTLNIVDYARTSIPKSAVDSYLYKATREEALEFEKLRKQLAIQFEFLKQHAPDWKPDWGSIGDAFYHVYYDHRNKVWSYDSWSSLEIATVHMPQKVAEKFCNLANTGLIEGLVV